VSLTQDGGSNLLTCKRALEDSVDNSEIFLPKQRIFEQECTAHVLQGPCKAAVINVESDDRLVSIEKTRTRLQACVTWTKKVAKVRSSCHCNLPCQRLLTSVKTRFGALLLKYSLFR